MRLAERVQRLEDERAGERIDALERNINGPTPTLGNGDVRRIYIRDTQNPDRDRWSSFRRRPDGSWGADGPAGTGVGGAGSLVLFGGGDGVGQALDQTNNAWQEIRQAPLSRAFLRAVAGARWYLLVELERSSGAGNIDVSVVDVSTGQTLTLIEDVVDASATFHETEVGFLLLGEHPRALSFRYRTSNNTTYAKLYHGSLTWVR